MPPTSRNYYEILGVTRDATAVEIHRAYRSLARQYHPDVNSSADARARFAELSGAYEVLHDPEQRVRYDRQMAPAVRRPARPGGAVPTFTAERRARQVPRFLDDEGRGQQLGEPAPAPWRLVVVWDLPLRVRARFGPARGRGV